MSDYHYGVNVLSLLNELAQYDTDDIYCGDFDVEGESPSGASGYATVEIPTLAEDAAKMIVALQQKLDALAAENAAREIIVNDAIHAAIALTSAGVDVNDYEDSILRLHEWGSLPDYCIAVYMDCIHGAVNENKLLDFGYIKGPFLTDAYMNSVRVEAVEGFTSDVVLKMRESGAGAYDYADIVEAQGQDLVLSLRSGTHDAADKAG